MTKQKGFTLIELLVVIAVIGLLSSIILVSLSNPRAKARDTKRVSDLIQIRTALQLFYDKYGKYPVISCAGSWNPDVWNRFQDCLETGNDCFVGAGGGDAPNYTPVMTDVPYDSSYRYSWGCVAACNDGQKYRLRAYLEIDHPVLSSDLDGNFHAGSPACDDPGYCIGEGSCPGSF